MEITTKMEDYLECIYLLVSRDGFASTTEIADMLEVHPSTASRMIKKLDNQGLITHEPYRGMTMTEAGIEIGARISSNHLLLEEFLQLLGIEEEKVIDEDIEGMEHHLSTSTIQAVEDLVAFFQSHPEIKAKFEDFQD